MLRKMKNKKGFTLIELMIVVAIVGILAAIAIPAYLDYTVKAKMSEVTAALDALATAANEYHAALATFPNDCANAAAIRPVFGAFSESRMSGITWTRTNADTGAFAVTLDNLSSAVNGCNLTMTITYADASGYDKNWSTTNSLAIKFMPRK